VQVRVDNAVERGFARFRRERTVDLQDPPILGLAVPQREEECGGRHREDGVLVLRAARLVERELAWQAEFGVHQRPPAIAGSSPLA
jgi:hypothetical protein